MKLFEYQAKQILSQSKLPVPFGCLIPNKESIESALKSFAHSSGVMKAQVLTGGRGKAGGIKVFRDHKEASSQAIALFGTTLVTKQTGPQGLVIDALWVEELTDIDKELYVAILTDRSKGENVIMISPNGGMDIEEVAETQPASILKIHLSTEHELNKEDLTEAQDILAMDNSLFDQFCSLMSTMYQVYLDRDATLIEINPLVITHQKNLSIVDCKMTVDDNALFRQEDFNGLPDPEHSATEIEAATFGLNYIAMEGNIGCMVNGAGLAMATMDCIKNYGGAPANFLDVGGSANEAAIKKALELISSDKEVKAILVNIFGGIMHCDIIARGIVNALEKSDLNIPLVVRLEGTNANEGKAIIAQSVLNIKSATSMDEAAKLAISLT